MSSNIEKAYLFASYAHKGQKYGECNYITHLYQVADIAKELGYDDDIIIVCFLHDILEDTKVTYDQIKKEFGKEVAEIVYLVTDELGRNRKQRKEKTYLKTRESWKATVVKICDRIANITYSIENSEKHLNMYKDEHFTFVFLDSTRHGKHTLKAWNMYNDLINKIL